MRNLLLQLLKEQVVIASWGISNIEVADDELLFFVLGFKYQGMVSIVTTDSNHANIEFLDNHKKILDVDICRVVYVIDNEIEVTDDYCFTLKKWLDI